MGEFGVRPRKSSSDPTARRRDGVTATNWRSLVVLISVFGLYSGPAASGSSPLRKESFEEKGDGEQRTGEAQGRADRCDHREREPLKFSVGENARTHE